MSERDERCGEPAAYSMVWPGKPPMPICETHYGMAAGIADVLGFYLHTEGAAEGETCMHAGKAEAKEGS